jgi:tetratricopeptide (TPR) repeat protein
MTKQGKTLWNRFLSFVKATVSCVAPILCCACMVWASVGNQAGQDPIFVDESMAEHYKAAQQAQSNGDLARAAQEYRRFLSEALDRLASRRAASGDLHQSIDLLSEALLITPDDTVVRLEYASACRTSGDLAGAKAAAERVLNFDPKNAKAQLELGRILAQMGDDRMATAHYEAAVALEPTFENGYVLAKEYLKRKDPERASKIFDEMLTSFDDSSELRLELGQAFAEAGFAERAIPEFEKALAQNERIRGGHYSLGAAYLLGLGEAMQDKAEREFREELQNYPDDPMSLYQLGSIEFSKHKFNLAERELTKATTLDESNPDSYLLLGQIYNETGRAAEAEAALRKCIELSTDIARNHYQVERAHYLLARILTQSGRIDEAKQQMNIASDLMKRNTMAMQGMTVPPDSQAVPQSITRRRVDAEKMREADAFERKVKGAVADSYNNLGVMAASVGDFPFALQAFERAAKWNPSLEVLDYNWGRAAFSAEEYQQAVAPLARFLESHPEDTWVRAALGSSYFSLHNYKGAAEALRPLEPSFAERPQLAYIYAVSLVKSGNPAAGIERLEALQRTNPDVAVIPEALSEAYASVGKSEKAAQERELAKAIQKSAAVPTSQPD